LQSVDNLRLANSRFQPFTVIYLDVRSLIVGDLVEILSKNNLPLFPYLYPVLSCKFVQFSILILHKSLETAKEEN